MPTEVAKFTKLENKFQRRGKAPLRKHWLEHDKKQLYSSQKKQSYDLEISDDLEIMSLTH